MVLASRGIKIKSNTNIIFNIIYYMIMIYLVVYNYFYQTKTEEETEQKNTRYYILLVISILPIFIYLITKYLFNVSRRNLHFIYNSSLVFLLISYPLTLVIVHGKV